MKSGIRCQKCLKILTADTQGRVSLYGQDCERWKVAWDLLKSVTGKELVDEAAEEVARLVKQNGALVDALQSEVTELKGKLAGAERAMHALMINHARSMVEPSYSTVSYADPACSSRASETGERYLSVTVKKHKALRMWANPRPWWIPGWLWGRLVRLVVSDTVAEVR